MPIFEYRCSNCKQQFEELVLSRTSRDHVECPHCGGRRVTPLVSRFAAQVSGSGASGYGECANQAAGICEAGGGPMT